MGCIQTVSDVRETSELADVIDEISGQPKRPKQDKNKYNASFETSTTMLKTTEPPFIDDIWRVYEKRKTLGEGAFAKVYAVTKRDNGKKYALKRIAIKEQRDLERFQRETAILEHLNHPNILKLNRTWRDDDHRYIVTKYCSGGELMDRVQDENFLSEKFAALIMQCVVSAIHEAHTQGIVHQDVKPENIVFDTSEPDSDVIVIDWGEARYTTDEEIINATAGTRHYLAPETNRRRTGEELKKGDMWAIGVVTYILLTGRQPFDGSTKEQIERSVRTQEVRFPSNIPLSDDAKQFVKRCLRKKVSLRCSAAEALQMPWLLRASTQSDENIVSLIEHDLVALNQASKLQKLVLNVAVQSMSRGEKREVKIMFEKINVSGSGRITIDELAAHFSETVPGMTYQQSRDRATELINSISHKNGDTLTLQEFGKAHVAHHLYSEQGTGQVVEKLASLSKSLTPTTPRTPRSPRSPSLHSDNPELEMMNADVLEEGFAHTFGRPPSTRERNTIREEFAMHFGKSEVTQAEFAKGIKLKSQGSKQDILVAELFPTVEDSTTVEYGLLAIDSNQDIASDDDEI